jgi:hypothetical protein
MPLLVFPSSSDRFEAELCPGDDAVVLVLARREGIGSETQLFVSRDDGATADRVAAPSNICALAARADRWVVATADALHATRDGGLGWTPVALGASETWAALAFAGDELWLGGGDRVLACTDAGVRTAWQLRGSRERIAGLWPEDGAVVVNSDRGRVLRGRAGAPELEDWSQGLPALAAGSGSPTIGRVGDVWLAFLGDLFARRDGDPAWTPLPPNAPPDGSWLDALRWLAPTESAEWVPAPWDLDTWLGTDGASVFEGGPRRALRRIWQRPEGRISIKGLAQGARAVFVSLRNTTTSLAGAAVAEPDRIAPVRIH